ncbi:MAG: DUF1566 domain-containing protein [Phycisphaerales bacterium]|nr:DUF1566 domain-containing protein [Phycisphaerales bacterium]
MKTKTRTAAAIPMPRIHSTYAGGEVMGVLAGQDGKPDYLLIDLGLEPEQDVTWSQALAWAASVGGDLPSRREQSVLFGNRRDGQYKKRWYWSCEPDAGDERCAWSQDFDYGYQSCNHKGHTDRARAVRRVPFQ